jgi:hypothetical protein
VVRSFRRGALAAVLALSLAPLAACAAGNGAETLNIQPDSAATTVGDIKVQNAYVLTRPGGPASITARLYNNGSAAQTLQAVQLAGPLEATLSGSPDEGGRTVTVPAHGSVLLGGTGNPSAVITSGAQSLHDGDVRNALFLFSVTGPVALPVFVVPATGQFKDYGPASPPPAPSPTASATATALPTPTGSATAAPGGTATPGATATITATATR